MQSVFVLSGPCGCGKTTVSAFLAKRIMQKKLDTQVYILHGDDFHAGFAACGAYPITPWTEILRFNWACLLSVAQKALVAGMDVLIDYIVEDELPQLISLAQSCNAELRYAVLTASKDELTRRLTQRGCPQLISRSLFLLSKLGSVPEYQNHMLDVTAMSPEEASVHLMDDRFLLELTN